jgi:hypothetical protein
MRTGYPVPQWHVERWLNAESPLTLEGLRGRVVLLIAFQMLCPGCVITGLPQARKVKAVFSEQDLAVVGLHTVFEHHEAQGQAAVLQAFLHENRLDFPIGIDAHARPGALPDTMLEYGLEGTPTTMLIDRWGRLRLLKFGHVDDLQLGAAIATLIAEDRHASAQGDLAVDGDSSQDP